MSIAARLAQVRARIAAAAGRAGRDPAQVRLVTVTKTHSLERIREAIAAGATLLGENRIEEAEAKIAALQGTGAEWHMIGHLQSRKARRAGELFQLVQSLDRQRTAAILGRNRDPEAPLAVLLEINVAGEVGKHGVPPGEAHALLQVVLQEPGVRVRGLMTMAPVAADPETVRPVFAALRNLRDRLAEEFGDRCTLDELSMGMSQDYEIAVEEGATLVRIGTAIMGPRAGG